MLCKFVENVNFGIEKRRVDIKCKFELVLDSRVRKECKQLLGLAKPSAQAVQPAPKQLRHPNEVEEHNL